MLSFYYTVTYHLETQGSKLLYILTGPSAAALAALFTAMSLSSLVV